MNYIKNALATIFIILIICIAVYIIGAPILAVGDL